MVQHGSRHFTALLQVLSVQILVRFVISMKAFHLDRVMNGACFHSDRAHAFCRIAFDQLCQERVESKKAKLSSR